MNYILMYLSALLFTTYGEGNQAKSGWDLLPKECGTTIYDNATTRIINGHKAKVGEFPWMARLGKNTAKEIVFVCGGSLINRFYVISAAHCEEKVEIVRLGENYIDRPVDCDESGVCAPPHQDIPVKNYFFEDFCRGDASNDLMILELAKPAQFNDFVRPICLPRGPLTDEDLINDKLTLAGWGVNSTLKPSTRNNELMYLKFPVMSPATCGQIHLRFKSQGQICVVPIDERQNVCYGDSGGPAFKSLVLDGKRRSYMFGVASYVKAKCTGGAVYTSILYFLDSILGKIKKG